MSPCTSELRQWHAPATQDLKRSCRWLVGLAVCGLVPILVLALVALPARSEAMLSLEKVKRVPFKQTPCKVASVLLLNTSTVLDTDCWGKFGSHFAVKWRPRNTLAAATWRRPLHGPNRRLETRRLIPPSSAPRQLASDRPRRKCRVCLHHFEYVVTIDSYLFVLDEARPRYGREYNIDEDVNPTCRRSKLLPFQAGDTFPCWRSTSAEIAEFYSGCMYASGTSSCFKLDDPSPLAEPAVREWTSRWEARQNFVAGTGVWLALGLLFILPISCACMRRCLRAIIILREAARVVEAHRFKPGQGLASLMGAAAEAAEAAALERAAEISVAAWERGNENEDTLVLESNLTTSSWASAQQTSEAKVIAAKRAMDEALASVSNRSGGAQIKPDSSETVSVSSRTGGAQNKPDSSEENGNESEDMEDFDTCAEESGNEAETMQEFDACAEATAPPTVTRQAIAASVGCS